MWKEHLCLQRGIVSGLMPKLKRSEYKYGKQTSDL